MKLKIALMIILVTTGTFLCLAQENESQPYRLIHADSLKANKVNDHYVSELLGDVHFFYGDTEFFTDQAFLYESDRIVRMTGNVKVIDDSLNLTADYVSYFRYQELLKLEGNVHFIETHLDSTFRTFRADRVEYLRENKDFQAWDNVSIYDSRENVHGKCGYMTYNANKSFGYLQQNPELKMAASDSILIKSRKIEYYDDYKKIVAIFEVETFLQDYYLSSDFLIYYSEEEKATYRGEPALTSDLFDAKGSEVTLFFRDNNLHEAILNDSCRVDYKVNEEAAKENWVTSSEMQFYFKKGVIAECRAYKDVISYYVQQKNETNRQEYILNEAEAQKLIMYMDEKGYIRQISLNEKIHGKYTFEAK